MGICCPASRRMRKVCSGEQVPNEYPTMRWHMKRLAWQMNLRGKHSPCPADFGPLTSALERRVNCVCSSTQRRSCYGWKGKWKSFLPVSRDDISSNSTSQRFSCVTQRCKFLLASLKKGEIIYFSYEYAVDRRHLLYHNDVLWEIWNFLREQRQSIPLVAQVRKVSIF